MPSVFVLLSKNSQGTGAHAKRSGLGIDHRTATTLRIHGNEASHQHLHLSNPLRQGLPVAPAALTPKLMRTSSLPSISPASASCEAPYRQVWDLNTLPSWPIAPAPRSPSSLGEAGTLAGLSVPTQHVDSQGSRSIDDMSWALQMEKRSKYGFQRKEFGGMWMA
mmetsp:Transcript_7396/g.18650  ORF Transcript_7396/g.18650 Transcript_7396/m.18650 type:complete len:164 (+) Transcript_7396:49-540(+)|eukprot:CAMPEP_0183537330 /NCGR_PEP_ID=MMETSP0371-20130417/28853_1 /TAXON_ID=268820 /ORGANISM="Peridinium aciculiferum, Strain PAER-2" /LENGTH=163 /DNA_ID=CAMNT_0025738039 /DNA_START=43 /DNA_END=534 /DNA_ORIENTATION=-